MKNIKYKIKNGGERREKRKKKKQFEFFKLKK